MKVKASLEKFYLCSIFAAIYTSCMQILAEKCCEGKITNGMKFGGYLMLFIFCFCSLFAVRMLRNLLCEKLSRKPYGYTVDNRKIMKKYQFCISEFLVYMIPTFGFSMLGIFLENESLFIIGFFFAFFNLFDLYSVLHVIVHSKKIAAVVVPRKDVLFDEMELILK